MQMFQLQTSYLLLSILFKGSSFTDLTKTVNIILGPSSLVFLHMSFFVLLKTHFSFDILDTPFF